MSSIFRLRQNADDDGRTAGGKIVRSRRRPAASRTPYARPEPPQPPPEEQVEENSGNPNWLSGLIFPARAIASGAGKVFSAVFGPESYSESSSSDGESNSEGEDDVLPATGDQFDKVLSFPNTKSEKMRLIQQLIMQETFSREECDELIKLIRSRVVKWDATISSPDVHNDAVMEARKWLEEKRTEPGSKAKLGDPLFAANYGALSFVPESEIGSPVDVAKSYMQARPSWSSPSLKPIDFGTPSHTGTSKMRGGTLSAGSWNILDEVRRVRLKATEELLATTPSKKADIASFSLDEKSDQGPLLNIINDAKEGVELHNLTSLADNSDPNVLGSATQGDERQTNDASPPKQYQSFGHDAVANGTDPDATLEQHDGYPHLHDMNGSTNPAANDHPNSLLTADQAPETRDKEMINLVEPSEDNEGGNIPKDKLELDDERPNHVLHSDENDNVISGSQDSFGTQHEESSSVDANKSKPGRKTKDTPSGIKLRPRRGRERGK